MYNDRMDDLPADIVEVLQQTGLTDKFTQLPPSHQREYLQWIDSAKKPETRKSRIIKMCEMLKAK